MKFVTIALLCALLAFSAAAPGKKFGKGGFGGGFGRPIFAAPIIHPVPVIHHAPIAHHGGYGGGYG
ncbi:hypothetical protein SK128_009570, partial [Halocaridina rubra]